MCPVFSGKRRACTRCTKPAGPTLKSGSASSYLTNVSAGQGVWSVVAPTQDEISVIEIFFLFGSLQLDAIHEHLNNTAMERITWIIIGYVSIATLSHTFISSDSHSHRSLIVVNIIVELVRPYLRHHLPHHPPASYRATHSDGVPFFFFNLASVHRARSRRGSQCTRRFAKGARWRVLRRLQLRRRRLCGEEKTQGYARSLKTRHDTLGGHARATPRFKWGFRRPGRRLEFFFLLLHREGAHNYLRVTSASSVPSAICTNFVKAGV
jgi:hypothetical protein